MKVSLRDTTAIITGSTGGLGTALVRALRNEGAQVIGIDVVSPIGLSPDMFIEGDVRSDVTMRRALEHVSARAWCFVPCATIGVFGEAEPSDVLAVNYSATLANLRMLSTALPPSGSAVLLGSIAASRHDFARSWAVGENLQLVCRDGDPGRETAYALSKWALAQAAPLIAAELAPQGIRVNLLVLGPTETPAAARVRSEHPDRWAQLLAEIPFGGANATADVGAAVTFLLSPLARRITASTICVDGGWSACRRPAKS